MYLLTPMDIHDHQFKKSFRGYSENEVDDFLDRVVSDFERILRDNERLKVQVNTDNKELEKYRGLEKAMNDTLMMAQRTADDVIAAARKNAEEMKESAARECQTIRDQAHLEAKQYIDEALAKRDAILADYTRLIRERNAFLLKVRTMLESELAITNHVLSQLPNVDEIVKAVPPKVEPAPPVTKPKPIEKPKPVERVAKPVERPKPVAKPPEPARVPTPIEDAELNLVDVSTKPVTDATKTYKPVKEDAK